MRQDVEMLMEVTDQLDKILFDDYVKRKSSQVAEIMRKGVLGGGIDWYEAEKPKGEFLNPPAIPVLDMIEFPIVDPFAFFTLFIRSRGSPVHLRRSIVSRACTRSSIRYGETPRRQDARSARRRTRDRSARSVWES
jgi:hypothetical protein